MNDVRGGKTQTNCVQGELRGAESALSIIICSFKCFYRAKGAAALLHFKTAEYTAECQDCTQPPSQQTSTAPFNTTSRSDLL